jgi:ribonuclease T1
MNLIMNKPMVLRKWTAFLLLLLFSAVVFSKQLLSFDAISVRDLPPEARTTLMLIKSDGPFPYSQDGKVFGNYESKLPKQKRGYYLEYTVKTPRAKNRGARRIVAGGTATFDSEYYYTDDHYESFRKIHE